MSSKLKRHIPWPAAMPNARKVPSMLQSTLTPAELAHLKSAMMTRARHPGATH